MSVRGPERERDLRGFFGGGFPRGTDEYFADRRQMQQKQMDV